MDSPTKEDEAAKAFYHYSLQTAYKQTLKRLDVLRQKMKAAGILVD